MIQSVSLHIAADTLGRRYNIGIAHEPVRMDDR